MKACVDGSTFCGLRFLGRVTVRSLKIDAEGSYEAALMADRKACSPQQSCEWNTCYCICNSKVWSSNSSRTTVYSSIVSKPFNSHTMVSTLRRVAYEIARTSQFLCCTICTIAHDVASRGNIVVTDRQPFRDYLLRRNSSRTRTQEPSRHDSWTSFVRWMTRQHIRV